jgi:hypothetical protein
MATFEELYIDQGTDYSKKIVLRDESTNSLINVSGYTVRSQMRRSFYSTNASANITCTITDGANGEITLSLTPNVTSNIKAGRYIYDVETVDANNITTRIREGIINIYPEITR